MQSSTSLNLSGTHDSLANIAKVLLPVLSYSRTLKSWFMNLQNQKIDLMNGFE